ncbi:hypothetical protein ME3_01072 [Bartonella melophagi K-2C]|uniref:Uncharacterized protein n=1 Tax=Bartonella melophagi K-2C TaxID=1094557 RepID=J1JVF5_9HYPH|nr:hypothetical protein ME3_01072 [Bartonella melophagi K-2C]
MKGNVQDQKIAEIQMGILYAIGLTETGHKESLQPYALNIDGKAVFVKTQVEALCIFKTA